MPTFVSTCIAHTPWGHSTILPLPPPHPSISHTVVTSVFLSIYPLFSLSLYLVISLPSLLPFSSCSLLVLIPLYFPLRLSTPCVMFTHSLLLPPAPHTHILYRGRIQRIHGVWNPMPELTITSPYVHSIVDSQHIYHGHWATLCPSRP
jgi:hypothetical protein